MRCLLLLVLCVLCFANAKPVAPDYFRCITANEYSFVFGLVMYVPENRTTLVVASVVVDSSQQWVKVFIQKDGCKEYGRIDLALVDAVDDTMILKKIQKAASTTLLTSPEPMIVGVAHPLEIFYGNADGLTWRSPVFKLSMLYRNDAYLDVTSVLATYYRSIARTYKAKMSDVSFEAMLILTDEFYLNPSVDSTIFRKVK